MNSPTIKAVADSAILVEFDNRIDAEINAEVLALMHVLQIKAESEELTGIVELVPSYRSLLLEYDCCVLDLAQIQALIRDALSKTRVAAANAKRWRVPVCYGGDAGCDLEDVARTHNISTDEVIAVHCGADFRAYMLGFAPGWCYLGGLPEQLHTPRLDSPRLKVPPGCISIGGQQGMIGALAMPSGWRLLGQTPVRNYDPQRSPPFLIQAGDHVSFYPISESEFAKMQSAAERGELQIDEERVSAA